MTTPNEQFSLTFTENPGYLLAHLKGETISVEIIRGYVDELVAKSNETGLHRILLVRDVPVILSGGEIFYTVSDSLETLRGKKLALVNPHSNIQSELEFGMTVGKNRGGDYAIFDNIPDAEAWLLS